jgi:ABC-2 type transport system ATP-binding protein
MTVIISSHILPEIEVTCDRVLIINQGRVVAQGSPAKLRRKIFGHSTYELETAATSALLAAALASVDASLRVSAETEPAADGFRRVTVTTDREDDIGEALLRTLLARDLRVRAFNRAHPSLEDVFLAATRRSWDAVAAPAPGAKNAPPAAASASDSGSR